MREFWTLFKYQFKSQTPLLTKGAKKDWLGLCLGFLTVAFLVFVGVIYLEKILRNYFAVEIYKVYAPIDRATEMLSFLYVLVLMVLTFIFLEHTRKVFVDNKDKDVFMRLPVSQRNIFLSKFCVIVLRLYLVCATFILTINVVTSTILPLGSQFWIATVGVCVFMPLTCLFFVTVLIVPYIKIIEMLSHKYTVLFFIFTSILVVAFIVYSKLLNVIQTLLTTGSIRFMFDARFVNALQFIHKYCYPTSAFVTILFGQNVWLSYVIIVAFAILSLMLTYVVSKKLYRLTLYRQPVRDITIRKPKAIKQKSAIIALLKKEFVCVYRQPKYLFSYLSVAISMPIMVYCCFNLFEMLLYNALGIKINFALALSLVLMFGVLTNTFCSTNVSRDGLGLIKMKTLPVRTDKLFLSKILFCALISCVAVASTCVLLICLTGLNVWEGLLCLFIGCTFTIAQVLVATKIDLNHAKISLSDMEMNKQSTRTLSKVILIGALLTLVSSVSVIMFDLFSSGIWKFVNLQLIRTCMYIAPTIIGLIYLACAVIFYRVKLFRSFEKFSN